MQRWIKPVVYKNEQDNQFAQTMPVLIFVAWTAYTIVVFLGLFTKEYKMTTVAFAGSIFQVLPYLLLRRGKLLLASWLFSVSILLTLTLLATCGQGYRDLAMFAFPGFIIFTGMALSRKILVVNTGLMLVCIIWLIFGQKYGLYMPLTDQKNYMIDLGLLTVISLVLAIAIGVLSGNMRKLLKRAQEEIVQRKTAEAELLKSESKYRSLVETTDTGFLILDLQGKVLDANREYVRISGHKDLAEILGRSVIEWTAKYEIQRNAEAVAECIKERKIRNLVLDYVDKNGRITSVEINATVTGEGASLQIISLCRDITDKKRMDKEKSLLQTQVLQSEKMAGIGQIASGVAHEINNPMTMILGYAQSLLRKCENSAPEHKGLKTIEAAALRCKKIVEQLLAYSRSKQPTVLPADVHEMINNVLSITESQLNLANIIVVREFAHGIKPALVSEKLEQVFMNLISNASDAMPYGGTLIIRTGMEAGKVIISFSDTGTGIEKKHLEEIFTPFFTTKTAGKGTGLGLAIVETILDEMHSEIKVESEAGKGTTFTLYIPAEK